METQHAIKTRMYDAVGFPGISRGLAKNLGIALAGSIADRLAEMDVRSCSIDDSASAPLGGLMKTLPTERRTEEDAELTCQHVRARSQ